MDIMDWYGAKGGVGTTTTAWLYAISQAKAGRRTAVVDLSGGDDHLAILGAAPDADGRVRENLWCLEHPDEGPDLDLLICDRGTNPPLVEGEGTTVLVVNNDYPSLYRVIHKGLRYDRLVLIKQSGRTLSVDDVSECVSHTPIVIEHTPAIALMVDAGLMLERSHRHPRIEVLS